MDQLTINIIWFLSLGALALNILAVVLLVALVWPKSQWAKKISSLANRYALLATFLLSLIAMLGSLYFSEIAGFNPCKWCWWQRIFMYPLVVVSWLALIKKDYAGVRDYVLGLSLVGLVIASYHYYLQFFAVNPLPCSVVGYYQESCAKRLFVEFGYITIPMMALSVFLIIVILALLNKKTQTAKI